MQVLGNECFTWAEEERGYPGDSFLVHQSKTADPVECSVVVEIDGISCRVLNVELDDNNFLDVLDVEVNPAIACLWI